MKIFTFTELDKMSTHRLLLILKDIRMTLIGRYNYDGDGDPWYKHDDEEVITKEYEKQSEYLKLILSEREHLSRKKQKIMSCLTTKKLLSLSEKELKKVRVITKKNGRKHCTTHGIENVNYKRGVLTWSDDYGDPTIYIGLNQLINNIKEDANEEYSHTIINR